MTPALRFRVIHRRTVVVNMVVSFAYPVSQESYVLSCLYSGGSALNRLINEPTRRWLTYSQAAFAETCRNFRERGSAITISEAVFPAPAVEHLLKCNPFQIITYCRVVVRSEFEDFFRQFKSRL